AGARYLLKNLSVEQLAKMERTRPVNVELLRRPGVRDELRREALRGLAREDKKSEPRVLLDAIAGGNDEGVALDLVRLRTGRPAAEMAEVRADLEKLATSARQPVVRQIGLVALVNVDGAIDKTWALASQSAAGLTDLAAATPLVADASLRAALYPKLGALLDGLPPALAAGGQGRAVSGRYVRIELPGKQRTLTLAEVEVFSDGRNVARQGKASQKNTAHGGDPSKGIDGNKSGSFGDGGLT